MLSQVRQIDLLRKGTWFPASFTPDSLVAGPAGQHWLLQKDPIEG